MLNSTQNFGEWFSLYWFTPQAFGDFYWENIRILYFLIAIPFIFILRRLFTKWQSRQKLEVAFSRRQIKWHRISLLRYIPYFFITFSFICIIIALARPQKHLEKIEQNSEGIDIMLVLDISESMLLKDFKPNRLEAAKEVAKNFIYGRLYDRIGLVIFSENAYSLSPLTTDYRALNSYIENINFDIIEETGTAIGTALGVATNRMRESESKSKVIILLSDGDNTAGSLDPITAAKLSAYYGIKTYTILVGVDGKVPYENESTGKIEYVENTVDESNLREIAQIGEGKFFRASNNQALIKVFQQINQYEKSPIIETRFKSTKDFYGIYLIWGIIFFLVWLSFKSTFVANILED